MNDLWFSARELAGLPGMPTTPAGVLIRAKSGNWEARKRRKSGGGSEWSINALPNETQKSLVAAAVKVANEKGLSVKIKPVRLIYEVVIGEAE